MRKLLLMSFVMVLALLQQAYAQSRTVTGTVTDQGTSQGLPGVAVIVKGTTVGTTTGADGTYSITVPEGGNTLVFRFIGYQNLEKTIGNASVVNAALATDDKMLSEVIVTGYATQTREEFTGAAATVGGDVIKDRPVQSFAQALTGRAAGVNIVQPNGLLNNPPVIRIRGINSISLSSFPLVVVDGIPISTDDASANSATNNPLGDINPSDIESIDILKDAASSSIYGSRAANGVLLITTKRGKQGKAKVTYDGWVSSNSAVRLPELLNAQQYIDHKNGAIANALKLNPKAVPASQLGEGNKSFFPNYNADGSMVDTDWYDEVYRTALSHNHSLTVSGGTDKTSYYFSAGFTDQEGFLKANDFERRSGRFNLSHQATDWMKLSANVNYNNTLNNAPNSGSAPGAAFNSSGLGRIAVAMSPNLAPRRADGSYNINPERNNTIDNGNNLIPTSWANPLPLIDLDKNSSETSRIIANLAADLTLAKGLTFRSSYSWDRGNTENIQFWNPYQGDGWNYNGYAYNNNAKRNNWNLVNTLQFQKSINDLHNFTVLVGSDVQKTRVENWGAVRQDLSDPFFTQFQGQFGINVAGGNGITQRAYEAYLGSVNYNFGGRYFISANYRRDGNSALAPEKRWGDFGGASVGWTISEEEFFKNSSVADIVTNFRLKGSWGRVGNGNLPSAYGAYTTYGAGLYGEASALSFSQAGNNELQWETSNQTNIGLDLGVLNNRISFEANYYHNDIDNLILYAPQAPSKGIPGNEILINVGSMYNKGFEFAINAVPVDNGNFTWSTNLNLTLNKNEVTSLANNNAPIIGSTGGLESANITTVGESVGSIYVVRTAGVNPDNGRRIFINKAGEEVQYLHHSGWTYLDGRPAKAVSSADAQVYGSSLPKWYGGFSNTLKYGNFDMNLMFTYSGGNYIYNGSQAGLRDQRVWNNSTDVLRAWTTPGQQTDIPLAVWGDNVSNGSSFPIDANVQKGDFLRLQTATLGYRLPNLFGNSGISSVRVYAQVDNAFLITKYKGVDPEISTNGNSNTAPGVERNTIPQGRAFTFGVNVGF
ncbi:TonB-linked SusC/RagA family outer membrane protein [Pontibacter mucosus]|uniref:TonB-linked SusC/RagA family outer membrane protein n=1 Tax=Pontibacter mucosus TaxID=1649266 RepID=A0A2T5YJJ5_9BACT|nr:SusC/RagA family TonB-linked outer membrane protein [Pontibacter mucosus]PTX19484.1 TonB-linked SusC/RagA family outer membrane protein [Pontibacter mucosus]